MAADRQQVVGFLVFSFFGFLVVSQKQIQSRRPRLRLCKDRRRSALLQGSGLWLAVGGRSAGRYLMDRARRALLQRAGV